MKRLAIAGVALVGLALSAGAKTVWTYWTSGEGKTMRRYISDASGWTLRVVEVEIDGVKGIGTDLRPLQQAKTGSHESQGQDGDLDFTTITDEQGNSYKFIKFGGYFCMDGFDISKSHVTSVVAPDLMDCDGNGYEFSNSSAYITNVVLSSEVRTISPRFLQSANALQHFEPTTFPKLTTIGAYAFGSSDGKHPVPMPSLICPELVEVKDGAFRLSPMTAISMPKVRHVGKMAFYQSSVSGEFDLPCLTNVLDMAFQFSQVGNFKATNLVYVGASAFRNLPNMVDFTAGEKLEYIGDFAFYGYGGSLAHFTPFLPKSLKFLGEQVFAESTKLNSDLVFDIPGITMVPTGCFHHCKTTNYVFKSRIKSVAKNAFTDLPRGSKLWFYSGCPVFEGDSIKTAYPRFYVYFSSGYLNKDARPDWETLAAESPIDGTDRARTDFVPKAIGKFCRNSTNPDAFGYVVPFRPKGEGLSVILR